MTAKYRALVVDDDVTILKLVSREFHAAGIKCDVAMDGEEALQLLNGSQYDVVVTDLSMPKMHGHALAHKLVHRQERPLIIVHTGVIETKLANDLLKLGVDDILFKPMDLEFLAVKVKAMLERRRRAESGAVRVEQRGARCATKSPVRTPQPPEEPAAGPVSIARLNLKIAEISRILPISTTTLDVYEMTRGGDWNLQQIAAAIQRDASLTAEVLRLANCSLYNPASRRAFNLDEAVLRLGQNRIGELALTAAALSALAPAILPWMDLDLAWKRSMASGIVMETLVEQGGHQEIEEGLSLCAILHPLGRIVLGMLFPKQYEAMVERCAQTRETLRQQERRIFPLSHTEITSQMLATWRVSPEVVLPLKFCPEDYSATAGLSEPLRTKTELVKLAILLGRLAVDRWESWDLVQFPAPSVLKRLGIRNVGEVVRQARCDVNKLAEFRPGAAARDSHGASPTPVRSIAYCNFSGESDDLLAELLPALGLQPRECSLGELRRQEEAWIANCSGAAPAQFAADCIRANTLVVTNQEHHDFFAHVGRTVALPSSYGRMRDALLEHLPAHQERLDRQTVPKLASSKIRSPATRQVHSA